MKQHVYSPFEGIEAPRRLVCDFFAFFSRFEFALKEEGYLKVDTTRAEPDWKGFAEGVKWLEPPPGSPVEQAIAYMNEEPPQVQMRDGKKPFWQVKPLHWTGSPRVRALEATCRVRNNLFHGGKHSPQSTQGRDERLIQSGLLVLQDCLQQHEQVRQAFNHIHA